MNKFKLWKLTLVPQNSNKSIFSPQKDTLPLDLHYHQKNLEPVLLPLFQTLAQQVLWPSLQILDPEDEQPVSAHKS